MNDSPGRGQRRPCLRWAAALAAMACMALLATACGGSSRTASGTGGSTRQQAALNYARCMRAHGAPAFPDPDSNGNFNLVNHQQGGRPKGSGPNSGSNQDGSSSGSSQEAAANHVCNHLLNVGTQLNAAQAQHALGQLVKYAQCMRAHGVPNFRDPHTTSGGIGMPGGIVFDMTGIDIHSPQYTSAAQACQSLAAHAKG